MIKNKNIKLIYFNKTFNKSRLKKLIYWSINFFGEKKTVDLIEILKKLGYSYATKAGLSLSIDDLKVPLIKNKLLFNTEYKLNYTNQDVEKGYLTSIEYFAQVIDIWNSTNDILKKEVISNFKIKDVLNPVYMMAFSGARGNISQVRQLVGMRGLMADPSGRIINFPIKSNFREGLTLTEYVISCYGARKGVVDTALRTATSGYLTRRLVDVAQHVIIRIYDCLTKRGIYLTDLKTNNNTKLLLLKNRLIGRVLLEDIYSIVKKENSHSFFIFKSKKHYNFKKLSKKKIATKNQEITTELVDILLKNEKPFLVRSPLTCQDKNYVCQLCYGWGLSYNCLVSLGESVGIIAAQSIGEPGTQLTMRTFHTGGVFYGHSSNEIISKFNGHVEFPKIINGKFVRTTHGKIAFLIKQKSFFLLKYFNNLNKFRIKKIILPLFTLLFVKQGQKVYKNQVLAEPVGFINELEKSVDIFQTIYSEFSGEIRFKTSKSISTFNKLKSNITLIKNVNSKSGQLWVLASHKQTILKPLNLFVKKGDFIFLNSFICLYNFVFLNNIIKNKFLNKKKNLNYSYLKYKTNKKLDIFNFFFLIKNKKKLNISILYLNLFIRFDYFQLIKLIKKNYFNKNKFKKLNKKYSIYSNINNYYIDKNNFKLKKSYFLSNFNIKKYAHGLKYEFIINLNSINKIVLFENKIKNYFLPIILFYFLKSNKNKTELIEKIKITYYYYIFKIPFNFTLYFNYIYNDNLKFFYSIKSHKLNLNYKLLFKLKNINLFSYYTKIYYLKKVKKKIEIYNKKFFISCSNNFSNNNKKIKKKIKNYIFNFLYFFKFNNTKIKSYLYNKSCFNFNKFFILYNYKNIPYLYINYLIKILNNLNKNSSYLLFVNSELNFFILAIFYKLLFKNKSSYLNSLIKFDYIKSYNYLNFKKDISLNVYFNKKINIWFFYFLLPNLKTTIKINNFLIKNKKTKNLFFYNFSLNIFKFYKLITDFSLNNFYLENKLKKKKVLFYNLKLFNKFHIYLFKYNLYNLKKFNYLFLSFFYFLYIDISKNKNLLIYKINKLYSNNVQIILNKLNKKILKKKNKKLILKKKIFIFFKIKESLVNKTLKQNLKQNLKKNLINFFLFYKDFLFKLEFISYFSLFKLKNKKKNLTKKLYGTKKILKENKHKFLYLKKKVIFFYFSSYILFFLLSNININFFNFRYFNFSKIILKYLKLKKFKIKKFKKINNITKNLKILYLFKYNINTNNNIKYNLIFYNIFFYKFIKTINLILLIFYKFIKKFNNKKFNFFINKVNKNFFSYFSINSIISYNDLFILLFYYKNYILSNFLLFDNNNKIKSIYIKNYLYIFNFFIFDKNKKIKNILFNKKQIDEIYLFLNKKNNFKYNISILWFFQINKFKSKFNLKKKKNNNFKYYNLYNFKIKNNNNNFNFKIIVYYKKLNFNYLLPFTINYINNKNYKSFCYYKNLNFLLKIYDKNENIKIKNNIDYKLYYFYSLINKKILKNINNIFIKNCLNKNLINRFKNLLIKYENIGNFINLNNIFTTKWIFYFNFFNINSINTKINFNFFYKLYFINNYNKNNIQLNKKYWVLDYLKKNILFFNKFNYYYDYWLFYKCSLSFSFLSYFKNINKDKKLIILLFKNYKNLNNFNKYYLIILPTQTIYLFKIQLKLNKIKNKISLFLFYFLFNFNSNRINNKKIEIKKNYLFNFFKLKYFYFKLKYLVTKYNCIYIKKIILINLNYILIGNLYDFKKYKIFNFKNKKIQKKFKTIFNFKQKYLNRKKKLINYYIGWFYIIKKSNFLMLNSKKIIPNGFFINKYISFENKITLNKFFTFRFKNYYFKNLFNFNIYLLNQFINFKIKKILLNSIFIFYGSKFFYFYLQKSILNLNNFTFNSYKICKNKWFIFTNFYFYKIKIKTFIYNNKIKNKRLNIFLINNYYRIIFFKTNILKKIKNNFDFSLFLKLKLIKHNILNKKNNTNKSLINSNILINDLLNIKHVFINYKRLFLINTKKINYNTYNRYKPKLLILKIVLKSSNLIIKFNKFKNICLIQQGFYLNNLNMNFKSLFYINNKILLSQNYLRYYILKFSFKNIIKIKKINKFFISNKKEKINNLFRFTYCNYLFLNKDKINLSFLYLFKNNKIKKNIYNPLEFLNKKINNSFYSFFYLKGYNLLNKKNYKNKIIINNKYSNFYKKNIFNLTINKKDLIIFFIYSQIKYKISKLYLIKNKKNYFFNFNITSSPSIYFYKYNKLKNYNCIKNYNSTTRIIYKKINTNILNFSKKFNTKFYKLKNLKIIKIKNYISKIYFSFKPFLIEKNNFLIQLNFIFNINCNHNILLLTSINKVPINIFNKLKQIKNKIKKISINYNNFNILLNKEKINLKLNIKLSSFKGEILNTYNLSFLYYYNYLKKNKNIKNINSIFNLKYNLKNNISLFPEIFYLTNEDFLTYKIINNNKFKVKLGDFVSCSTEIIINNSITHSGQIIFLNKNKIVLRRAKLLLLSSGCICNLKQGDYIKTNSPLLTLTYKNLKTEDIVQGIPKIEQIFEARENLKDKFSLNSLIKLKFKNYKKLYSKKESVYRSIIFIQQYIVDYVQKIYQSQGVNISDKHIEIIVKQMTSKVRITNPGNTGLLRGDIVYLDWIELINDGFKGKKSQYEPIILGISKACLEMDGFISAASFQETIKILSKAAILQKRDFLRGLKENIILGHLIPIGTGFDLF